MDGMWVNIEREKDRMRKIRILKRERKYMWLKEKERMFEIGIESK